MKGLKLCKHALSVSFKDGLLIQFPGHGGNKTDDLRRSVLHFYKTKQNKKVGKKTMSYLVSLMDTLC